MADPEDSNQTSPMAIRQFARRTGVVVGIVAVTVVLFFLVAQSITVFFLLFAGMLWAIFLRGAARLVESYVPLSERLVATIFLGVLLALAGVAIWLAVPGIVDETARIAELLPKAVEDLEEWARSSEVGAALPKLPGVEGLIGEGEAAWNKVTGIFSGALGVAGNTLLIFVVGVYLAFDPDLYIRGVVRLFPLDARDRAREVVDKVNAQLAWWLGARLLGMVAVAVVTSVGLLVIGVPLAVTLGVLTGLLAFVPVVGPVVATVPAGLLALQLGPMFVLYVILLYVGVQMLENYVIMPVAGQVVVDLPPALIILAQVLLGLLTGMFGVLLATPLLVALMVVVEESYIQGVLGEREVDREAEVERGG